MGKIVINETDAGQKVLLDTNEEGVTGGYYDKQEQWHEFGSGGGGVEVLPALTVTFKNRAGQAVYAPGLYIVTNGILTQAGQGSLVEAGDDYTYTTILPNNVNIGARLPIGTKDATEMINCTIFDDDGDKYVVITNVSEVASCTITDN